VSAGTLTVVTSFILVMGFYAPWHLRGVACN
jgi:hypothetical protein